MKQLGKKIIWQRAHDYLARYKPLLIGITGSTGKTITKDALVTAIGRDKRVRSAPHSYNTPIGVALSILGLEVKSATRHWVKLLIGSKSLELTQAEPEIIILELGADRPGDIDFLAGELDFTIGIVTNAQSTHLRLFQDKQMVAHEMMSLVINLPKDGHAILNHDDPLILPMKDHIKVPTLWYGSNSDATVEITRYQRTPKNGFACEVKTPAGIIELHLQHIIAAHHLPHLLAALTTVVALNGDVNQAAKNLQRFVPPPGRMRLFKGIQDSQIIDDTYNAPPESVLAALDTMTEISASRRIVVLGDMLDLGGGTVTWHEQVGEVAAQVADLFITVGDNMKRAGAAALRSAHQVDVHQFSDSKDVGKWLTQFVQSDDLILVKGSRDMHMEEVVKRLLLNPDDDAKHLIQP